MMVDGKKILVVDDDKNLRLSLSLLLKQEGYEVETAATAQAALEMLKTSNWDLMFLDLNMPGMGGIELLSKIYEQYPNLSVLILTANATLETAIKAIRLGARDYLLKPAEPREILTRVSDVLEKKKPARRQQIVGELQSLLAELHQIEGMSEASAELDDPARYLRISPFVVDLYTRNVSMGERHIPISGIYFDYFVVLLRHAPKFVGYKTLVREAQGYDVPVREAKDLARWRIHELRKLVEDDPRRPRYILTVRGEGYRLAQ